MINSFYINNTHVSRKIRKGIVFNEYDFALVDRKEDIVNRFCLKTTEDGTEEITYIDMMIADAVYSLYRTEQSSFSEGMILRALSGDDKQTCRRETKERIRKALEKMARVAFSLDCKKEMRARNIADFDDIVEESFISLVKLKSGNYENTNPPLYQYAEKIHQLIAVPSHLWSLDHKKPVNDSLENIAIKHYLLCRIAVANYDRHTKNLSNLNTIYYYHPAHRKIEENQHPFTGMLFDLGVVSEWEKENGDLVKVTGGDTEEIRYILSRLKNKTHKNTKKILKVLMEMEYIEGYSEVKLRREIIGIKIEPFEKKMTE